MEQQQQEDSITLYLIEQFEERVHTCFSTIISNPSSRPQQQQELNELKGMSELIEEQNDFNQHANYSYYLHSFYFYYILKEYNKCIAIYNQKLAEKGDQRVKDFIPICYAHLGKFSEAFDAFEQLFETSEICLESFNNYMTCFLNLTNSYERLNYIQAGQINYFAQAMTQISKIKEKRFQVLLKSQKANIFEKLKRWKDAGELSDIYCQKVQLAMKCFLKERNIEQAQKYINICYKSEHNFLRFLAHINSFTVELIQHNFENLLINLENKMRDIEKALADYLISTKNSDYGYDLIMKSLSGVNYKEMEQRIVNEAMISVYFVYAEFLSRLLQIDQNYQIPSPVNQNKSLEMVNKAIKYAKEFGIDTKELDSFKDVQQLKFFWYSYDFQQLYNYIAKKEQFYNNPSILPFMPLTLNPFFQKPERFVQKNFIFFNPSNDGNHVCYIQEHLKYLYTTYIEEKDIVEYLQFQRISQNNCQQKTCLYISSNVGDNKQLMDQQGKENVVEDDEKTRKRYKIQENEGQNKKKDNEPNQEIKQLDLNKLIIKEYYIDNIDTSDIDESYSQTNILFQTICPAYVAFKKKVDEKEYMQIVMKRCTGDLKKYLNDYASQLELSDIFRILFQINSALHQLSDVGIVHMDLKLLNIFYELSEDSSFKKAKFYLADFGEAIIDKLGLKGFTPNFMPKQINTNTYYSDDKLDQTLDMYSFAKVILIIDDMFQKKQLESVHFSKVFKEFLNKKMKVENSDDRVLPSDFERVLQGELLTYYIYMIKQEENNQQCKHDQNLYERIAFLIQRLDYLSKFQDQNKLYFEIDNEEINDILKELDMNQARLYELIDKIESDDGLIAERCITKKIEGPKDSTEWDKIPKAEQQKIIQDYENLKKQIHEYDQSFTKHVILLLIDRCQDWEDSSLLKDQKQKLVSHYHTKNLKFDLRQEEIESDQFSFMRYVGVKHWMERYVDNLLAHQHKWLSFCNMKQVKTEQSYKDITNCIQHSMIKLFTDKQIHSPTIDEVMTGFSEDSIMGKLYNDLKKPENSKLIDQIITKDEYQSYNLKFAIICLLEVITKMAKFVSYDLIQLQNNIITLSINYKFQNHNIDEELMQFILSECQSLLPSRYKLKEILMGKQINQMRDDQILLNFKPLIDFMEELQL